MLDMQILNVCIYILKSDQTLNIFREQKQIFGYINFRENIRIFQQRGHAQSRRFTEASKNQVAAEQIRRVMLHHSAKELRKHNSHDQQR